MNRKLHLILVLGCVLIAVLDAPRATRLFSEGLAGPYGESARVRATLVERQSVPAGGAAPRIEAEQGNPAPAAALLNSSVRVAPTTEAAR